MKKILALTVSTLLALVVVCCGNPNDKKDEPRISLGLFEKDVDLHASWKQGPFSNAYSTAILKFSSKGAPKTVQILLAKPWMSSMGHGSHEKPTVRKIAHNEFEISKIFFTMSGPWELEVDIMIGNAQETIKWRVVVP